MLMLFCDQSLIELHLNKSCTQYLHDFLDLIESEMLVVETNDPRDKRRIACTDLANSLKTMLEVESTDYFLKPVPWSKSKGERTRIEQKTKKVVQVPPIQPTASKSSQTQTGSGPLWTGKLLKYPTAPVR